jgi:hypothetical protein
LTGNMRVPRKCHCTHSSINDVKVNSCGYSA